MEGANHGGITAGEHAQDAAFGAAVVLLAAEFDQHLVAVHGRADGVRRNEDTPSRVLLRAALGTTKP